MCTSRSMLPLQVEWENAELKGQLLGVTQERDSALRKSQGLQSKLESLEQVLKVRGPCRWHKERLGQQAMYGALGPAGGSGTASFCHFRLCFSFYQRASGAGGSWGSLVLSLLWKWWVGKA